MVADRLRLLDGLSNVRQIQTAVREKPDTGYRKRSRAILRHSLFRLVLGAFWCLGVLRWVKVIMGWGSFLCGKDCIFFICFWGNGTWCISYLVSIRSSLRAFTFRKATKSWLERMPQR